MADIKVIFSSTVSSVFERDAGLGMCVSLISSARGAVHYSNPDILIVNSRSSKD